MQFYANKRSQFKYGHMTQPRKIFFCCGILDSNSEVEKGGGRENPCDRAEDCDKEGESVHPLFVMNAKMIVVSILCLTMNFIL